jgi:hypothetical protein
LLFDPFLVFTGLTDFILHDHPPTHTGAAASKAKKRKPKFVALDSDGEPIDEESDESDFMDEDDDSDFEPVPRKKAPPKPKPAAPAAPKPAAPKGAWVSLFRWADLSDVKNHSPD